MMPPFFSQSSSLESRSPDPAVLKDLLDALLDGYVLAGYRYTFVCVNALPML